MIVVFVPDLLYSIERAFDQNVISTYELYSGFSTSTAMGDGAWLCTYLAAGATQPDKLVLRIMGHEHLVEAMGTSMEAKLHMR